MLAFQVDEIYLYITKYKFSQKWGKNMSIALPIFCQFLKRTSWSNLQSNLKISKNIEL